MTRRPDRAATRSRFGVPRSSAILLGAAMLLAVPHATRAGHSRHAYCDGGQSADGRFVVLPQRIEPPPPEAAKDPLVPIWRYVWKDTQTGETVTHPLHGLKAGRSDVFDPVHAHVFVAPGGETFAVWNPNVLAPAPAGQKAPKDATDPAVRDFAGYSHRLTIYRSRTGEIAKRLDLKNFLLDSDWPWIFLYQSQVYWQDGYPGLTRDNAPRVGYALFRISPDHTVLETRIAATSEAVYKAKERGVTPPEPRLVRVDLVTGRFLPADEKLPTERTPVRPFVGPLSSRGEGQKSYVPSLDPVRLEGTYGTPATPASSSPAPNATSSKGNP